MDFKDEKRIVQLRDDPVLHEVFMDGVGVIIAVIAEYFDTHKTMNRGEFKDLMLNPMMGSACGMGEFPEVQNENIG